MRSRNNAPTVEEKRGELRALMTLLRERGHDPGPVDAMLEAVLKQQEGRALGHVKLSEQSLVNFLDVLPGRRESADASESAEGIVSAYLELARDEKTLFDPEQKGYVDAAVYVDLARETTGYFVINVALKNIDGAQVAFVLDVARRYELEAREEGGYLTLRQHLIYVEAADEEHEPEAVEASTPGESNSQLRSGE